MWSCYLKKLHILMNHWRNNMFWIDDLFDVLYYAFKEEDE